MSISLVADLDIVDLVDDGHLSDLHLTVVHDPLDNYRGTLTLYVNGVKKDEDTYDADQMYPGAVLDVATGMATIFAQETSGLSELRLYDRALREGGGQTEISDRYRLGRFIPGGATYRSGIYRLGEKTRMTHAHWAGFMDARIAGRMGFDVRVQPCDAGGNPVGPPVPVARRGDLEVEIENFYYEVEFVDGIPGAPLYDTPVFESISFSFQRPSRLGWVHFSPAASR